MTHEIIERYLETLRSRDVATATLKAARSDLAHLTSWWEIKHQRPFDPADLVGLFVAKGRKCTTGTWKYDIMKRIN